jgi:hypothetical protein
VLGRAVPARSRPVTPKHGSHEHGNQSQAPAPAPGAFHQHEDAFSGVFLPLDQISPTAQVVAVGTYWVNITAIDFQADTCYLTAHLWLRWQGDTDPTASLEFANAVEAKQLKTTASLSSPKVPADGSMYQEMRVNGARRRGRRRGQHGGRLRPSAPSGDRLALTIPRWRRRRREREHPREGRGGDLPGPVAFARRRRRSRVPV